MIEIHMSFTDGAEARHELTEFAELIMNGAAPDFTQISSSGITIEKRRTTKPLPDTIDCKAASTQPVAKVVQYGENGAAQASEPLQKTQPPTPTVSAAADSERPQPAPTVPAAPQQTFPPMSAAQASAPAAPQVAYTPQPAPLPQAAPQPVPQPAPMPQAAPAARPPVDRQAFGIALTKWASEQTDGLKLAEFRKLLSKYGVISVTALRDEDLASFAADVRPLGVAI